MFQCGYRRGVSKDTSLLSDADFVYRKGKEFLFTSLDATFDKLPLIVNGNAGKRFGLREVGFNFF